MGEKNTTLPIWLNEEKVDNGLWVSGASLERNTFHARIPRSQFQKNMLLRVMLKVQDMHVGMEIKLL